MGYLIGTLFTIIMCGLIVLDTTFPHSLWGAALGFFAGGCAMLAGGFVREWFK